MDPGTAFEIGYAVAKGKQVVLWSETGHSTEKERVLALGEGGKGKWGVLDGKFAMVGLLASASSPLVFS